MPESPAGAAPQGPGFFTPEHAQQYDERNRKLAPISENLHFLLRLVLERLPARARILSVGAGTGAEILTLARAFAGWTFVAVEPSRPMLEVCRERLQSAGVLDRCELVHGFAQDLPADPSFDAACAILVAHFVGRDERAGFYRAMADRLRDGGTLVSAEISFDLNSATFAPMLENWGSVQSLMGASTESVAALPKVLREVLTVLAPEETEALLRQSGIALPVRFFQAFLISAWYGVKAAAGLRRSASSPPIVGRTQAP